MNNIIIDPPNEDRFSTYTAVTAVEIDYDCNVDLDASIISDRLSEPTLPMWVVMNFPSFIVDFLFCLKRVFKLK